MNPMQIMAMLQNSGNPMQMLTQMAQQNPMMERAMQMGKGKNEVQLKETVRNLAKQRGMSDEQLQQMLSNFGLTL
nr:MAG TPA: SurA N-terminal domain [Caudoviricetes sp.]